MIERLSSDEVVLPMAEGHRARYQLAAEYAKPGTCVLDVACGVGYGASFFPGCEYHGFDRPGIPEPSRWSTPHGSTTFHACDLNDRFWTPEVDADVTCCFETLEHVENPSRLAHRLAHWTGDVILVSAPVIPTKHTNPYHLHDFTREDVPALFPGWEVLDVVEQPSEFSCVWILVWR